MKGEHIMYAHIGVEDFEVWRDGNSISLKKIKKPNKIITNFLKSQNDPMPREEDGRRNLRK
jgi:hypothetical protein